MNVVKILTIIFCLVILFGCGGKEPEPVAKSVAEPLDTALSPDEFLKKADSEKSEGLNQLALETYRKFLKEYPDSEKAGEVKTIIAELEKQAGQARRTCRREA